MRPYCAVALALVSMVICQTEAGWWSKTRERVKDAAISYVASKAVEAAVVAAGKRDELPLDPLDENVWGVLQQACPGSTFNTQIAPPAVVEFVFIENDEDKNAMLDGDEYDDFAEMVEELNLCNVAACSSS